MAVVIAFALLLSTVAWVGARAAPVRTNLLQAGQLMRQLQERLVAYDIVGARATLSALQDRTHAARSATGNIDWRLGAGLPAMGDDLAAVRTVARVLDDLSHTALPTMVDLVDGFDFASFLPSGGRLGLTALRHAAPAITAVDAASRLASDQIAAIPSGELVQPLRSAVAELGDGLDQFAALTGTAARASVLLPSMLGANGQRTYLVLLQNLTDVRATGGKPGAFLVVRADGGELRIVGHGSAPAYLKSFDYPVLPLEQDMAARYTERMARFSAEVNVSPHFPTAAALAREMYRRRSGIAVDGVLAVDPVALSYLLRATGPLSLASGGSLTADNAVRVLLPDPDGRTTSAADQDEHVASAAGLVFEGLIRGAADPRTAVAALARASAERRLLLWSADPVEQTEIAGTVLEGSLPIHDGIRPTVGVFLNDGGGAKLGYYLTHDVRLEVSGCRADGRRELALQATLGSTAAASVRPDYRRRPGANGDADTLRVGVMVFSPAGGSILDVRLDGEPVAFGNGVERRRQVGVVTIDLKARQFRTIKVRLITEPLEVDMATAVTPELWGTPGVNPWRLDVASTRNCSVLR